jgi:hypothetical protein
MPIPRRRIGVAFISGSSPTIQGVWISSPDEGGRRLWLAYTKQGGERQKKSPTCRVWRTTLEREVVNTRRAGDCLGIFSLVRSSLVLGGSCVRSRASATFGRLGVEVFTQNLGAEMPFEEVDLGVYPSGSGRRYYAYLPLVHPCFTARLGQVLRGTCAQRHLDPGVSKRLSRVCRFHRAKNVEIIDVEPGEAEWGLNILGELFDFYFVQLPARQRRREALNIKLTDAKKPPMKTPPK